MVPTTRVAVIPPAAVNEADVSRPVRKPRVRPAPSPLRIFPVSRKIQGIWARKGPSRRYSPRFREQIQGVPYKFPRYRNREFRWLNRPIALSLIARTRLHTRQGTHPQGDGLQIRWLRLRCFESSPSTSPKPRASRAIYFVSQMDKFPSRPV